MLTEMIMGFAGKIGRKISIENQTLWDRDQACRVATLRLHHGELGPLDPLVAAE